MAELGDFITESATAVIGITNSDELDTRIDTLRHRDIDNLLCFFVEIPEGYTLEDKQTFIGSINLNIKRAVSDAKVSVDVSRWLDK